MGWRPGRLGSFPLGRKRDELAAIAVSPACRQRVGPAANTPGSPKRLQSGADISRGNSAVSLSGFFN